MVFSVLLLGMTFQTLGCSTSVEERTEESQSMISIPMILTVDPSSGKKNQEELVNAFNQTYQGTYRVEAEYVMETEEEYRTNLKRLNVTGKLPAVITDIRLLPSFYQMMIKEGRIEDLTPYLETNPEWKQMIEPAVLESCREKDGNIYLGPIGSAAFSCSGVYWNETLFREAGIKRFPKTWKEFWKCCDKLQAHGITPLALHTEGTGWAPMLFATAELTRTGEGAEFMKQLYPGSYRNDSGLHMAKTLKRLFQYTSEDALHADFDVAYSNFVSGQAAMLPNGYWMMEQFPEYFISNVRFSTFPGNELISSPETFGWAVVSDYSDEVKRGAVEFLKFRTRYDLREKQRVFDAAVESNSRVLQDYINAFNGNPVLVPNYQVKWNSILQEETLGECLPGLVRGKMTPEEFVLREDESILQYQKEQ